MNARQTNGVFEQFHQRFHCSGNVHQKSALRMVCRCASVATGCVALFFAVLPPAFPEESAGESATRLPSHTEQITEMDPVSWVRPKALVGPDYPKRALAEKITGVVDVELVIDELGGVKEVRSISSQPKNEDFEAAVRAVVEEWVFEAPRFRCVPTSTVGNLRVWFNIKGGEAAVSVSYPQPLNDESKIAKEDRVVGTNWDAVRKSTRYPRKARKAGAQANAYVELHLDPKSGAVASVDVAQVLAPPLFEDAFRSEVKRAAAELVFKPMPNRSETVVVCVPFTFRLTN